MSRTPGFEIERKFLVVSAPTEQALRAHGARPVELQQWYLHENADKRLRRLRQITTADSTTYVYTKKRGLGGIVREEQERDVSPAEAAALLMQRDPAFGVISKRRWTWHEDGQTWELDVFSDPAGLVLLEVELETVDEHVSTPPWLGHLEDVSLDPRYQNATMARRLAKGR